MIGGRGFVGQEIISILNDHPIFMLSKVFSKTAGGEVVEGYKKASNLKYCLLDKSQQKKLLNSLAIQDVMHLQYNSLWHQ